MSLRLRKRLFLESLERRDMLSGNGFELEALLRGDTRAAGAVELECGGLRCEVEVALRGLPPNTEIEVVLVGEAAIPLATLTTNNNGRAAVETRTQRSDLPGFAAGDEIQVLVDGESVLSGILNGDDDDDDDDGESDDDERTDAENSEDEDAERIDSEISEDGNEDVDDGLDDDDRETRDDDESRLRLSGDAGEAKLVLEEDGDDSEFKVVLKSFAPNTLVQIGRRAAGQDETEILAELTTSDDGDARLHREADDGETVPDIAPDDEIRILVDGVVVLSGTFSGESSFAALDDTYDVAIGATLTTTATNGVLANDDAGAMNPVVISGPDHGPLTLNEDGSFTYTQSTFGFDQFIYEVVNASGQTSQATVALQVPGLPPLPLGAELATLASGLQFFDFTAGTGASPLATDTVTVDYVGYLPNGEIFNRNDNINFLLLNLIAGFSEGVQGMQVGGTRRIIIPPDLGYGPGGNPDAGIGGEDVIIFDVTLDVIL